MAKTVEEKPAASARAGGGPFTTISGRPDRAALPPAGRGRARLRARPRRPRPVPVHPRRPRDDVPRQGLDHAAVRGLRLARAQTNERFKYLLAHGGHGLSVAFDLPTLMGRDPDHPLSLGEVGKCGVAVTSLAGHGDAVRRHPAGRGHHLHDHQLAGGHAAGLLHPGGREAGRAAGEAGGHHPGRHPEGVHRPEGVHLPAAAEHARDRGHDPLLHRAHAEVEHDLHLRLPHPRGGLDGRPGAGLHPARRDRVRAVVRGRGAWTWTASRRASPSSSTPTPTSSRRSPSSGRRAGSGRAP